MPRLDNRSYYDDFAGWYERERHRPYHRMLDDLEVSLLERYGTGRDVLEVGCGTGLILGRASRFARTAIGVDLSGAMLVPARGRGLAVVQAAATALPFPDECFDVVCAFKVLAHIPDVRTALAEMARVVRPGGWILAEFYNAHSLRRLVKAVKPPSPVSETTTDQAVFTRYDSPAEIRSYLPTNVEWITSRGVRIVTATANLLEVPGVGPLLRRAEATLADLPGLRGLAGFLIVCAQRRGW